MYKEIVTQTEFKKKTRHIHKGDGKPFQNEIKLP